VKDGAHQFEDRSENVKLSVYVPCLLDVNECKFRVESAPSCRTISAYAKYSLPYRPAALQLTFTKYLTRNALPVKRLFV
jgi:hypothetical protein